MRWDTNGVNVDANDVRGVLEVCASLFQNVTTVVKPANEEGPEKTRMEVKTFDRPVIVNIEAPSEENNRKIAEEILQVCRDKQKIQPHVFDRKHPPAFAEGYDVIMAWCYSNPDDYDTMKRVSIAEVQVSKMLRAQVTARDADENIATMRNLLKEDLSPMLKIGWYMAENTN